jgi:hypothetical protein
VNIDELAVDQVSNEVGTNVDVLYLRVCLRVMCACNHALIVVVQRSGRILREAQFYEE